MDSRVRVGDRRARAFLPALGGYHDSRCFSICLSSHIWTQAVAFFIGRDFKEPDLLRLLILHRLLHGGKHLEELVAVEWRLGSTICIPSGNAVLG